MQEKYKIFNLMDIKDLEVLFSKSDLTEEEYWVLKYSLGTYKSNIHKIDRLSICDRLNISFSTFRTLKLIALTKVYKVYKDHINKLKD